MRKIIVLCCLTLTLTGCMSRTTGRMGDIFNDSAKNSGSRAGGG